MKVIWILSLIIGMHLHAQVEHVKLQKTVSNYPNIAGYYDGEIPIYQLCDHKGIMVSDDIRIIQYTIQYNSEKGNQNQIIYGHQIPEDICDQVAKFSIQDMIFFTNILAVDLDGRIQTIVSFNLIPISDEGR